MCLIGVEANSAGLWPSRTEVSQPWCSVSCVSCTSWNEILFVLNFKKHFFSVVKKRCTLQILHIPLGAPLHPGTLHLPFLSHIMGTPGEGWELRTPASSPLTAQCYPEATEIKNAFLNMQNKCKKPDKHLLYTFIHTHCFMYNSCHFK